MSTNETLRSRVAAWVRSLQDEICEALTRADGAAAFREDLRKRAGGGGGITMGHRESP